MQNQNVHPWPWGQGPAPAFPGAQPLLPTNFPPPGVDQSSLLPGYQHMYGGAPGHPPPEYNQWTATQIQQWQQWQQWQEKYQQWQAQYGKKYAESLAAIGQAPSLIMPGIPSVLNVPKPIEPTLNTSLISNPPLPASSQPVPPPPPDEEKPPLPFPSTVENNEGNQCGSAQDNPEELSEAEKTFDIQFKQWEGQFNEWKKQNQDHPDKAQYIEYEKKWETWRAQLLQRREQMRKKRLNKTNDQPKDGSNSGKPEELKPQAMPAQRSNSTSSCATTTGPKPVDSEYCYKTQSGVVPQNLFTNEPSPKLDGKLPFFEKPQEIPSSSPSFNNSSGGCNQDKLSMQPIFPPSNFGVYHPDNKIDTGIRQGSYLNKHNFNRNSFGNQIGFDDNQEKAFNANPRFGNYEGDNKDLNPNSKFRNESFDNSKVNLGENFDNFGGRPKFGNNERNFGLNAQRIPGENFRNERDFNQQRCFDGNRDRDIASQNFSKDNFDGSIRGGNDRGDFGSCPPNIKNLQNPPLKPKVPSLFDITVEKPPNLVGSSNDRKLKIWEKYEKDEYFNEPFDKRQDEKDQDRNDKPWGNSNAWSKTTPSPWLQPWEIEKMTAQKLPELRPWENKKDNRAWINNLPGKQEIDKAELSGYVGNILAKLGNFNVMPSNLPKDENSRNETLQSNLGETKNSLQSDSSRRPNWNKGTGSRGSEEKSNVHQNDTPPSQSADTNIRNLNRGPPPGARDFDERGTDYCERLRDGSFAPTNFDRLNDSAKDVADRLDIDERLPGTGYDDRVPFRRDDRNSLGKDEMRNFTRPASREDRRNYNNDERFFGREDRSFGRPIRDERSFGRFNSREDVDDRYGGRNGRRNFDRFYHNDRDGRFFNRPGDSFDRFGRNREQQLNEPVWNPQVFDYSQGQPQKLADPEEGFKISTVVDYSHGENKQAFDYGRNETSNDKLEIRSFDYEHKTEAPTVIDYGHGVDRNLLSKECRKEKSRDGEHDVDDRLKLNAVKESPVRKRSRSPRGRLRSHSRSPHSRFKRGSKSPPFRGINSKSRDRLGRQTFKRDRNGSEDKLSPGDGEVSKHSFDVTTVLVEDLICLPGRETRPNKLVFIMRGIPGSGKTYVTKLIKDKEIELGKDPPRILSLDDYFMTEVEKEIVDKETGRKVKTKVLEYEYEAGVEPHYKGSLLKAFKKTVSDGFFSFIIVDSVNEKTKDYEEMWSFAKQKGFQVYIAEMDNDVTVCKGRNIHKRTEKEISDLAKAWEETPPHYLRLDVRSLLQSFAIAEVEMEVVSDTELDKIVEEDEHVNEEKKTEEDETSEKKENEDEDEPGVSPFVKSRWDQFENSEQNLDRLDGLKRRREGFHTTMEDYLQLPDDFDQQVNSEAHPGKKRVRWADLEERRQQEKMRAIGFVVGQTDWSRMTDPTFGESALTRTKYI